MFCKFMLNERIHYHLPVISSLFVKVNVTYDLTFLSYVTVEEIAADKLSQRTGFIFLRLTVKCTY